MREGNVLFFGSNGNSTPHDHRLLLSYQNVAAHKLQKSRPNGDDERAYVVSPNVVVGGVVAGDQLLLLLHHHQRCVTCWLCQQFGSDIAARRRGRAAHFPVARREIYIRGGDLAQPFTYIGESEVRELENFRQPCDLSVFCDGVLCAVEEEVGPNRSLGPGGWNVCRLFCNTGSEKRR